MRTAPVGRTHDCCRSDRHSPPQTSCPADLVGLYRRLFAERIEGHELTAQRLDGGVSPDQGDSLSFPCCQLLREPVHLDVYVTERALEYVNWLEAPAFKFALRFPG